MHDAKPMKTPMSTTLDLNPNLAGKEVDLKVYHSMIGSLLYLCASRPDIMYSVGKCARFQASPRQSHLEAVKQIFRYLLHTPNFGIWYPKGSSFQLIGYSDADYAGDKTDRKSTSGVANFLVAPWCVGLPIYKTTLPSPPPKPSTSPRLVVVLNCYG